LGIFPLILIGEINHRHKIATSFLQKKYLINYYRNNCLYILNKNRECALVIIGHRQSLKHYIIINALTIRNINNTLLHNSLVASMVLTMFVKFYQQKLNSFQHWGKIKFISFSYFFFILAMLIILVFKLKLANHLIIFHHINLHAMLTVLIQI
jgi:hypothetical protein